MDTPNDNIIEIKAALQASLVCESLLEQTLRAGAQRLLAEAIEAEVEDCVERHAQERDGLGHRLVVRNGHLPERTLQTGLGAVRVKAPRIEDGREGRQFTSALLPRYLRKVPSLENLIPALYLMGVSTSDMQRALEAILGPGARGLSSTTVVRLNQGWQQEFVDWNGRDRKSAASSARDGRWPHRLQVCASGKIRAPAPTRTVSSGSGGRRSRGGGVRGSR